MLHLFRAWTSTTPPPPPVPDFIRFFKLYTKAMDDICPRRTSHYAAGVDVQAYIPDKSPLVIQPGERQLVSTGLMVEMPDHCYGRIAPRSGLALKGIDVCAGVIDNDYSGEIKILLHNHGKESFPVHHGDRIAQLICEHFSLAVVRVYNVKKEEEGVDEVDCGRSDKGFGSSGGYQV